MRKARVNIHGQQAGVLQETADGLTYLFEYTGGYSGPPISLTMPTNSLMYQFSGFPPFFEGLLPEGIMLDGMLRRLKIDRNDYFSQLVAVGEDLVGAVTVELMTDE